MVGVFAGGSSLGSYAAGAEPGIVCSFDEHAADTADTATVVTDSSNSNSSTNSSTSKRAAGLVLHGEQLTAADLQSSRCTHICSLLLAKLVLSASRCLHCHCYVHSATTDVTITTAAAVTAATAAGSRSTL
eukprot:11245-Heterococcus_DN1.PRE.2